MVMDPSGNGTLTKVADLPFQTSCKLPAAKFAPDKVLILDNQGGAWVMDMSGDKPTFQKTGSLGEVRKLVEHGRSRRWLGYGLRR